MQAQPKITCPVCQGEGVIKHGINQQGKQRYQCKNPDCEKNTFIQDYQYLGCRVDIQEKIVEMALNGNGVRDTGRVLGINKNTVVKTLKKERYPQTH